MCSFVDEARFCTRPRRGPNHIPAPPPGPPRLMVSCESTLEKMRPAREIRGKPKNGRFNSYPYADSGTADETENI